MFGVYFGKDGKPCRTSARDGSEKMPVSLDLDPTTTERTPLVASSLKADPAGKEHGNLTVGESKNWSTNTSPAMLLEDPTASSASLGPNPINELSNVSLDPHDVDQHDGYNVASIELFSDLVIVVAIHIIAGPLEERDDLVANLPWYFIRVFHLWLIWHSSQMTFHLSHLMKDVDNPVHYIVVLTYMNFVMVLAQAYRTSDNYGALIYVMILRSLEVIVFAAQVNRRPPRHFDPIRLLILRSIPTSMIPNFAITEVIPISLSLYFADGNDPNMPLVYLSIFLVMAQRTHGAYKVDAAQRISAERPVKVFDDELMKERYELLALIFIGEIAFAAAGPSEYFRSAAYCICVMMTACGCYLLCFAARVRVGREFWNRSGVHIMTGQHFYICIFCAIPGIGAGFMHIAESMEEMEEGHHNGERRRMEETELICDVESSLLLISSAVMFLIFSALIHSMTIAKKTAIIRQRYLGLFRIIISVICTAVYFLPSRIACIGNMPVVTFMIPILFFVSACVEIWGQQELGYSMWEWHWRRSTVQRTKPLEKQEKSRTLLVVHSTDE